MKVLVDAPLVPQTDITVVLAHGAGAGMDSDFMSAMARGLCDNGVPVVRFETGTRRPPDRMPILEAAFVEQLQQYAPRCVAAGKSMGGRVASMMLAQQQCLGAISLGYPFHPPGKPENLRTDHWGQIVRPWLIVQGTRDPFGTLGEVGQYSLPESAQVEWLADGDHDFKPRKASGFRQAEHWQRAVDLMTQWLKELN
jgi:hypothetical protein